MARLRMAVIGVGHLGKDVACKGFVVCDARLPHEGRICGEALNQGVLVKIQNAALVGAVGENLDLQLGCVHVLSHLASALHDSVPAGQRRFDMEKRNSTPKFSYACYTRHQKVTNEQQ